MIAGGWTKVIFTAQRIPALRGKFKRKIIYYNLLAMSSKRFFAIYTVAALMFWAALDPEGPTGDRALPVLSVEAALIGPAGRGFCGSDVFLASLGSRTFRWVCRCTGGAALWRHGRTLL